MGCLASILGKACSSSVRKHLNILFVDCGLEVERDDAECGILGIPNSGCHSIEWATCFQILDSLADELCILVLTATFMTDQEEELYQFKG